MIGIFLLLIAVNAIGGGAGGSSTPARRRGRPRGSKSARKSRGGGYGWSDSGYGD